MNRLPKPCLHKRQTLCEWLHPEYGRIVTYQCDDCGMQILPHQREVTADDIERTDLPPLDEGMYESARRRADDIVLGLEPEQRTAMLFARALRP